MPLGNVVASNLSLKQIGEEVQNSKFCSDNMVLILAHRSLCRACVLLKGIAMSKLLFTVVWDKDNKEILLLPMFKKNFLKILGIS
ncbi:hypothetical protein HPP92_004244 [Vanilla planifolia]|uniref:Uncharacterized protein n=1 Tax=Vanilla planifolia TaxID=51239 RepID=A0A835RJ52_VANPL|nr:hypothetical protein HPP92_004244 [Vanilla planifolia]